MSFVGIETRVFVGWHRRSMPKPFSALQSLSFVLKSQQTSVSQSLTARSLLPLSLSSVLPGGPHRSPGIIYLHPEFIRNHPVSLATGLGSRYRCLEIQVSACGCYSVYHTPPGSSFRNHSLQSSVVDAVGVPPTFLTHQ